MKRVGLYVRVSTEEQKKRGLSVDNQIDALRQYVAEHDDMREVALYNDAGLSANKTYKKRPALLQMAKDCQDGKLDLCIFTKLDRFFRSVGDYYAYISMMNDVPWRAIWEDYETETSAGKFKVNIMLSVAQTESDRTSERIKATNEYRRAKGEYVGGKAPTGYVKQNKGLVKDDSCKEAVQAFFDSYSQFHSMIKAREVSSAMGFDIAKATAVRMLHNTAYYGDASGYKCEPYITYEQYQLNQIEMNRFSRTHSDKNNVYYFSGMMICGVCGNRMVAKYARDVLKDGTIKPRLGYECSKHRNFKDKCSAKYFGQKKLEALFLESIGPEMDKVIIENATMKKTSPFEVQRRKLEGKLKRLTILFEEGDISIDAYKSKRDAIKEEISLLPSSESRDIKPLPKNWRSMYHELDDEHKKAFWQGVIERVYIQKDCKPIFVFK